MADTKLLIDTFETLHKLWLNAVLARKGVTKAAKTTGDQEHAPEGEDKNDQEGASAGEERVNQEDASAPQQEQEQERLELVSYGEQAYGKQADIVAHAIAEALGSQVDSVDLSVC